MSHLLAVAPMLAERASQARNEILHKAHSPHKNAMHGRPGARKFCVCTIKTPTRYPALSASRRSETRSTSPRSSPEKGRSSRLSNASPQDRGDTRAAVNYVTATDDVSGKDAFVRTFLHCKKDLVIWLRA